LTVKKLCYFDDDAGGIDCQSTLGEAFRKMSAHTRDVPDQVGFCFGLIVPSHLLEPERSGVFLRRALRTISDIFKVHEDRWPHWVHLAVRHLLDCDVMRVGPAFALVLGCPAECDHGLTPGPMCVLLQGMSSTPIVEISYKGWEPSDYGIGFLGSVYLPICGEIARVLS